MESGPLPPHERTWRHPSELAADHRAAVVTERPSATARVFAVLTGAAGMALVGIAVLALTPRGAEAPVAVDSTPSPSAGPVLTTLVAARAPEPQPLTMPLVVPLITPLERGRLAIAPSREIAALMNDRTQRVDTNQASLLEASVNATLTVRFSDGATAAAVIIDRGSENGLALLEIADLDAGPAYRVAAIVPADHEMVTVVADEPITVPLHEARRLRLSDGAPVVNDDGELVGLCLDGAGGFIPIDVLFAAASEPAD